MEHWIRIESYSHSLVTVPRCTSGPTSGVHGQTLSQDYVLPEIRSTITSDDRCPTSSPFVSLTLE